MQHEEPLVKIDKSRCNSLSISTKVNTRAFHDAFLAIPLPTRACEGAYQQAGRILQKADGTEFEYLTAIGARSGQLVTDNLDAQPTRRTTGFRKSNLEKNEAQGESVVLIHNHPSSIQPSFRDVLTAAEWPTIAASIVVGHDGSLWFVLVHDPLVAERLRSAYNSLKDLLGDFAENAAVRQLIERENGKSIDWRRLR